MRSSRRNGIVALAAAIALAAAARAQVGAPDRSEPDRSAWESGWHVVRPGDTLEGLAERFLGSSQLWRELHGLNDFVADPDLLQPGQRLRIFLERPTPEPSAQIVATSRKVNELPRPAPWRPAGEGDVLLEKDGLRTEGAASARLLFDDGATLNLSADSLIFIRRQTRASAPAPRKEIEIELGQAEIQSPASSARSSTIEVVVGGAKASSSAGAGASLKTRSRKSADESAQFMVYEGASRVAAAGQAVQVPAGNGTTVPPKAPPTPPEPLLPAPTDLEPGSGGEFDRSAPRLAWAAVPGAASYLVEICRDAACGAVVELVRGIAGLSAAPREPHDGELFWRVTAIAPSGLDGFPSPTARMVAVESVAPPAPEVKLVAGDGRPLVAGACIGELPDVRVRALDRSGRELDSTLLLDGQAVTLPELRGRALAGEHRLAARATDARGRSADSAPFRFTVDGAAPWAELAASPAVVTPQSSGRRNAKEVAPGCDAALEFRSGAPGNVGTWTALPCAAGSVAEPAKVALGGTRSIVELRSQKAGLAIGDLPPTAGESIQISFWDVGCGLAEAALRVRPSVFAPGLWMLEVEVADLAGNRRTLGWHLGRR